MNTEAGARPARRFGALLDSAEALWAMVRDPQRLIAMRFLADKGLGVKFADRWVLVRQHYLASGRLISPHTTEEMLTFIREILTLPADCDGCIVEAGSYKGSSSAKFSLAARLAGRRLVICDSFQGLPASDEVHGMSIEDRPVFFHEGEFAGSLEEVRSNIAQYGALEVCDFVEGWFDTSLVGWDRPIAAIYIDIDLAASTRICLKHLYPWMVPGAALYSQDGHLPLVLAVFEDCAFWNSEFGIDPPAVEGIWKKKLIKITKPQTRRHDDVTAAQQ
jgi:O-methyltransferase